MTPAEQLGHLSPSTKSPAMQSQQLYDLNFFSTPHASNDASGNSPKYPSSPRNYFFFPSSKQHQQQLQHQQQQQQQHSRAPINIYTSQTHKSMFNRPICAVQATTSWPLNSTSSGRNIELENNIQRLETSWPQAHRRSSSSLEFITNSYSNEFKNTSQLADNNEHSANKNNQSTNNHQDDNSFHQRAATLSANLYTQHKQHQQEYQRIAPTSDENSLLNRSFTRLTSPTLATTATATSSTTPMLDNLSCKPHHDNYSSSIIYSCYSPHTIYPMVSPELTGSPPRCSSNDVGHHRFMSSSQPVIPYVQTVSQPTNYEHPNHHHRYNKHTKNSRSSSHNKYTIKDCRLESSCLSLPTTSMINIVPEITQQLSNIKLPVEEMIAEANEFLKNQSSNNNKSSSYSGSKVRRTLKVKVRKTKQILGIVIEGGYNVSGQLVPRIVCVHEDGAAYECDQLRLGDLILSVNGQSTANLSHEQIAKVIASAYYRDPNPEIEFLIGEPTSA